MKNIFILITIIVLSSLTVSSQGTLDSGLVAYYPFTGNANDSSGYGNDGVINGPTLINDRPRLAKRV